MRKNKKLLALLLTMAMMVMQSVPALAADGIGEGYESDEMMIVYANESEEIADDYVITESANESDGVTEDSEMTEDEGEIIEYEIPSQDESEEADSAEENIDDSLNIEEILPCLDLASFNNNAEIRADKAELREHVYELNGMVAGENYSSNRITVAADSAEEAEEYAKAFAGTLLDWEYGYALIELNTNPDVPEVTVEEVVMASADNSVALPAAWPNYYGEYCDDSAYETAPEATEDASSDISEFDYTESSYSDGNAEFDAYRYNDPFLVEGDSNYQWQHYMMQTNKAWQAGYTGKGVKVAVIDSGAQYNHEDLSLAGFYKWNGTNAMISATPEDNNGHGSHCTGIVGAKAGNGKGGAGIAPGASVYTFKIAYDYGDGETIDMYAVQKSINKAVEMGIDVISISLSSTGHYPGLEAAVENAYYNGTAVFVASGNSRSNIHQYPAAYAKAIAVAAVNQSNALAHFADVSNKVRYTGPGVDIYSTYRGSASSYTSMDGTSQATPCVAGAAAVVLSSGKVTGTGKEKVDNLLKLMDKCCVASGAGRGTPNLAKGLGLANSVSAPAAPIVSIGGVDQKQSITVAAASVDVKVTAEYGAKIYYALNNGNVKYKDGKISDNAIYLGTSSGTVTVSGAATNKLSVMAVSSNNGMCSKESIYNIKLEPKVSGIVISAPNDVFSFARGGSLQLSATIKPAYAKNKAVTWELVGAGTSAVNGISISTTGKLTAKVDSTATSVTVKVTPKDGGTGFVTKTISIQDPKPIKDVKATPAALTINDGQSYKPVILTTYKDGSTSESASLYSWVSANTSVATCTLSSGQLTIKGIGIGKTTITGLDTTGQGKKVTISVTVNQRISSLSISGYSKVAQGKSLKPVANIEPAKVTNNKLNWELISCPASTTIKDCGVTVAKATGAITTKATAVTGSYTVRATAVDAGAKSNTFTFNVIPAASMIKNMSLSKTALRLFRVKNSGNSPVSGTFTVSYDSGSSDNLTVTSSAPGIATASISGRTVTVRATGNGTGTVKITVAATDGTGLKKDCKVTVVNPITKLYITPPKGRTFFLTYGATMKLTPVFVTESGAIDADAKKLVWTSSNDSYIKVDKSGTIKAMNRHGKSCNISGSRPVGGITITAKTTDGSNMTATYDVIPVGTVTGIWGSSYGTKRVFTESYGYGYLYSTYPGLYTVKVSGPTDGITGAIESGIFDGCDFVTYRARKKGIYRITVKRNDGSNRSTTGVVVIDDSDL